MWSQNNPRTVAHLFEMENFLFCQAVLLLKRDIHGAFGEGHHAELGRVGYCRDERHIHLPAATCRASSCE